MRSLISQGFVLLVTTLICLTAGSRQASSQCPADDGNGIWVHVIDQQWTLSSGCQVAVTYCYRDVWNGTGYTREFYVEHLAVISGCTGMTISEMMAEVADQLYTSITDLPLCNGPIPGKLVETIVNNCWQYDPMLQVQGHPEWKVYTGCSEGTCEKTCSICYGWDPLQARYRIFVSNCESQSNYQNNNCQEGPPSMDDWNAYVCYHLPCGW